MLFGKREVRRSPPPADFVSPTLESLYAAHFNFVCRAAARLGGPQVDPEDVVQEVFLVVQRRLHTFDGSSKVTTWLYGITLKVAHRMRSKAWRRSLLDLHHGLGHAAPEAKAPCDPVEVAEAHRIAHEILETLPSKKRDVFILAEFEELGCDEIAAIVGTKAETVWSRLHYARKEFSARLARRHARS